MTNTNTTTFLRVNSPNGESVRFRQDLKQNENNLRTFVQQSEGNIVIYIETTHAPFDPNMNYRITEVYHITDTNFHNLSITTLQKDYATIQAFCDRDHAVSYLLQLLEFKGDTPQ